MYRVTVVDNSNYDLRHYSSMTVLSECGFEITAHTSDPARAVAAAAAGECDMILCINRPSAVIATDLLKLRRRSAADIPVVVISKVNASGDMRECFLLGVVDYLNEPFFEEDMRAALLRASKAIGKRIVSAEYGKVMKQALSSLPITKDSETFTEKLRELLIKTQGSALTVEAAADHFGFNPDYFARYFKSRSGQHFSEFYRKLTMEYAKLLLSSGHYKVGEVSELLGFASPDYFSRVFRKVTGSLPSQYKK